MFARKKKHLTFKAVFTFVILGCFALLFVPFAVPMLLAAIVAFALEPFLARFDQPAMLCRKNFVVLSMLLLALIAILPIAMGGYKIYVKAIEISQTGLEKSAIYLSVVQYKTLLFAYANKLLAKLGLASAVHLNDLVDQALGHGGKFLMAATTYAMAVLPDFLLSLFIFFLCLYVFLTQAKAIKKLFLRMDLLQISETNSFIHILQKTSYTVLVSSILIGAVQASIVALGGLVFGSWDFLLVFALTFFFSFIPIIGAAPMAVVLAALNFVQLGTASGISMLVVATVAGVIDNILRPFLVKDDELHPAISLVSLIGAVMVFGISGLFLGPVLATLSINVIPVFFKKKAFFDQWDELHVPPPTPSENIIIELSPKLVPNVGQKCRGD